MFVRRDHICWAKEGTGCRCLDWGAWICVRQEGENVLNVCSLPLSILSSKAQTVLLSLGTEMRNVNVLNCFECWHVIRRRVWLENPIQFSLVFSNKTFMTPCEESETSAKKNLTTSWNLESLLQPPKVPPASVNLLTTRGSFWMWVARPPVVWRMDGEFISNCQTWLLLIQSKRAQDPSLSLLFCQQKWDFFF